MADRVVMTITADEGGRVTVDTRGPLAGKAGALALLDQARGMVEAMRDASSVACRCGGGLVVPCGCGGSSCPGWRHVGPWGGHWCGRRPEDGRAGP